MGMEISGAELAQVQVQGGTHVNIDKDELEEPIKFGALDGSHGAKNEVPKGESDPAVDSNFPKDAVDEWPAPKQIHYFYFVRFRPYEDPKLKAKIEQADKEIQKKNQARFQLTEALKAKRSERATVISQLKPLTSEDKQYKMMLDEKRKELEPLQAALGKLRGAGNVGLCSSEEELNDLIASLHYRIQHESNTLAEEKQLLKEIKLLQGTREKVVANDVMKAKIQDSLGRKEAIQDQVKLIGGDLDGVRKEQQDTRKKIKRLEEELKTIDSEISSLQEELVALNQKKDKAYETINGLRKAREEGNAHFYQNRSLLNNAKDLAAKKDIAALEELSYTEMEKFMSLWNTDKAFRDDYERRILPSLDGRQLSRDGRMRNPDEKSLISEVVPPAVEPVTAMVKANTKRTKEDVNSSQELNTVTINKAQKEGHTKPTEVHVKEKVASEDDDFFLPEKPHKETPEANGIDPVKLKEMKREEEMAKAKLASERKKKLAEKAAAKAAVRAQKEAEKKHKEREKRAKKKAGASVAVAEAEHVEAETNDADAEETEVDTEPLAPAAASAKMKEPKDNVRSRKRPKAQDSLQKVILRRKKSQSYWIWAVPATVIVLMIAIVAYYYYF